MNANEVLSALQNQYGHWRYMVRAAREPEYVRPVRKWTRAANACFVIAHGRRGRAHTHRRFRHWYRECVKWGERAGLAKNMPILLKKLNARKL